MAFNETESTLKQPPVYKQGFDYATLSPATQCMIQQHTCEIKKLLKRTAQDILIIGQKLIEVKAYLGYGKFEAWLKLEFHWGLWTARKFMQVARKFESVNFTELSIDASALYLLAAPSVSNEVCDKVFKLAEEGESITYKKVKEISNSFKDNFNNPAANMAVTDNIAKGASAKSEMPLANSKHLSREQTLESTFGVGNTICITDLKQKNQERFVIGKISEVETANAAEIKIVINVSVQ